MATQRGRRQFAFSILASVSLVTATSLSGQGEAVTKDSTRVLLLEQRFGPDSAGRVLANLERRVVYRVEMIGPGTPVFQPLRRSGRAAFVVPIQTGPTHEPRRFEIFAMQAGPHELTLADLPVGATTMLRLYRDSTETRRVTERRERDAALGLYLAVGIHSGYRLDPTGGADPRGGSDLEGCVLIDAGDTFGTCVGAAWQSFPDATYDVTWLFIEQRARFLTGSIAGRRTAVGAVLRYSHGLSAGPRRLNPGLLGLGLYVRQHLAADGRRRGLSLFGGWLHTRLGEAPETERLDSDRLTVGVSWIP